MEYVIQVCWQLAIRIKHPDSARKLSANLYDIYHCCVYSENSWWWTERRSETCRVSLQEQIWEISASSWFYYKRQAVSKPVWHIPLLCVQWKTHVDGKRNCPKHVEFHSRNKFEELMYLVGFIIKKINTMHGQIHERRNVSLCLN